MNRALSLDEPDHLRHRVLRRYRDEHVHVIGHQMPLLYPAFPLLGQPSENLPKVLPQLPIQRAPSALRYEHHVVFAHPRRVVQTFELVHRVSSFRVLGGSRSKVSTIDTHENVKLLLPPRQSRGTSLGG